MFGTKISTTNGPERFNKQLNLSIGKSHPNLWKFLDFMNKVLDEASLDHRIEAKNRYKMDRNFSAVCFIEFMAEK